MPGGRGQSGCQVLERVNTAGLKRPAVFHAAKGDGLRLYLVRHGETEYNRHDLFRGLTDIPLNETGRLQARAAAEYLKDHPIAAFYSGPLQRSRDTCDAIARAHGAPVRLMPQLQDIDYGEWSGRTVAEVREGYPQVFRVWGTDPERVTFPGGESLADAAARVEQGLAELAARHPDEAVVAVGHKMVNRLILCAVLDAPIASMWHIEQFNGAINVIDTGPRGYLLVQLNETSHLLSCGGPNGLT
ncbi:MAG: histidine phosphatase family protein [Candidatus Geothermincolia bacterium]